MGFGNEIHNLTLLKKYNGNMDKVAEVLLTESSSSNSSKNNNNKNAKNNGSSSLKNEKKKIVNIEIKNKTMSQNSEKERGDISSNYKYSNLLNQLKEMGFMDISQIKAALDKVTLTIFKYYL